MNKFVKVPLLGGVNLQADPSKVRPDQAITMRNLVPVTPGIIGTRPAMQWTEDLLWSFADTWVPVRAAFSPVGPEFVMAVWRDGAMLLVGLTPQNFNLNFSSLSLGAASNPQPASMVQWDGDTYAFTGVTPGARLAYANNAEGFILEQLDFGAGNANFLPLGAAIVRDRFVYWGFDRETPSGGRGVVFADRGLPLQIGDSAVANARVIQVAGISNGPITHCAEINMHGGGSPNQSTLAVWTADQMWQLLGEPGEVGDSNVLGSLQQSQLQVAAGCVSGATVAQTPYGTIWAGPDDVWFMPFGSMPVRIGTNIRPALLNTPPTLRWKWHAAYDADKAQYRLALFGQDVGPTEYSGCETHWILDLSQGGPQGADDARWFGPQVYNNAIADPLYDGTLCLLSDLGSTGSRKLFGVARYNETVGVEVLGGLSQVTLGADDVIDSAAAMRDRIPRAGVWEYFVGDVIIPYDENVGETRPYIWTVTAVDGLGPNGGGVTDSGPGPQFNDGATTSFVDGGVTWTAKFDFLSGNPVPAFFPRSMYGERNVIRPEVLTREEFTGDPMVDKLIDGAEVGFWTNMNHVMDYRLLTGFRTNSRILEAPKDHMGVSGFESAGPYDPPDIRGQRLWQARYLPASNGERSLGKSSQFWMKPSLLYPINASNDMITMVDDVSLAWILPIEHGNYTYAQLLAAIKARLEANTGPGWLFATSDVANGSLEAIAWTGDTRTISIVFQGLQSFTSGYDESAVCARLFQLLGFDVNNAAEWGYGSGIFQIDIAGVVAPPYNWVRARSSMTKFNASKLQLSDVNLRIRPFKRRPS